jgi:hypothetical protein
MQVSAGGAFESSPLDLDAGEIDFYLRPVGVVEHVAENGDADEKHSDHDRFCVHRARLPIHYGERLGTNRHGRHGVSSARNLASLSHTRHLQKRPRANAEP